MHHTYIRGLFVGQHGSDDLAVRAGSHKGFTQVSHSLCRSLAEDVTAEGLGIQDFTCSGNLESLLG